MNKNDLASSVVYWLEYERLCGRQHILSEYSLRQPISEHLISTLGHDVNVEIAYPSSMQASSHRPKSMDFCVSRAGGNGAWKCVLETKFITSRRNFVQEIFDDMLRLEIVRQSTQVEPFERLLVLAGRRQDMKDRVSTAKINPGAGGKRITVFQHILPRTAGKTFVANVHGAHPAIRSIWATAAVAAHSKVLPNSITVTLDASMKSPNWTCRVWRINSSRNRVTHPI